MRMDGGSSDFASVDAGDKGCGGLIIELRKALDTLRAGGLLELFARDPGAPVDMPAWCRITGHELISATHPLYIIRKKGD